MSIRAVLFASAVGISAMFVAASSLVSSTSAARAEGGHSFVIPANDGYGLAECLAEGSSCGRLVADAWCEAQGYGKADTFGPADPAEVTSSLSVRVPQTTAPKSYAITCRQ